MSLFHIVELEEQNYFGVDEIIAKKYIETLEDHIKYVREAGKTIGVNEDQSAIHDDSKWTEAEFPGYAMHFQGGGAPEEFSRAWLHHIHKNPHHWQHWIFPDGHTPKGSTVENGAVEMPYHFVLEMVADWMGSEMTNKGRWDMSAWLIKNIPKIRVHSKTAKPLRSILDSLGYADIISGMVDFANHK